MVSGTPIPVPKVDKADTKKFTKTVVAFLVYFLRDESCRY
jgi:hypothetical protein